MVVSSVEETPASAAPDAAKIQKPGFKISNEN
jgi:hypothetical protein